MRLRDETRHTRIVAAIWAATWSNVADSACTSRSNLAEGKRKNSFIRGAPQRDIASCLNVADQ
ncbi:MAG TPA: hypothetical protein VGO31_12415 [Microbacteriaceae bacterium]|nr:hypothetical protein [Microbacteriaceae bacterium]